MINISKSNPVFSTTIYLEFNACIEPTTLLISFYSSINSRVYFTYNIMRLSNMEALKSYCGSKARYDTVSGTAGFAKVTIKNRGSHTEKHLTFEIQSEFPMYGQKGSATGVHRQDRRR